MEKRSGYVLAIGDGYIENAIHVERDDECVPWRYETDEDAARAAERDGIQLIYGMPGVPDGVYLDTPENRKVILKTL